MLYKYNTLSSTSSYHPNFILYDFPKASHFHIESQPKYEFYLRSGKKMCFGYVK